jgi:dTDP-4-dehydrorhamnose reductase
MSILIMGDGLLGSELHKQTGWDIISRKRDGIDITNPSSYVEKLQPYSTIINCIACTDTYSPSRQPAWDVNYVAVIELVNFCRYSGRKLIQISTDYIYSHSIPFATEEDVPVHCDNWYAYTKLLADAYVQAKAKDYLLIRTSFKPAPFPWGNAWVDLEGNFDYVDIIAGQIITLIEFEAKGVFNIGTDFKSMYELASETKDCLPIEHNHEPYDVSMSLDKLRKFYE